MSDDTEPAVTSILASNTSQIIDNQAEQSEGILNKDFIPLRVGGSTEESDNLGIKCQETTTIKTFVEEIPGPSGIQNDDGDDKRDEGDDDDNSDGDDGDEDGGSDNDDGDINDGGEKTYELVEQDEDLKESFPDYVRDDLRDIPTPRENEFTSEIFKISISNLPRNVNFKQLKKMIESQVKVKPVKMKCVPKTGVAFVTFRNEEERQKAKETLHHLKWKKRKLKTKIAKPMEDPIVIRKEVKTKNENKAHTKHLQALAVTMRQSQKAEALSLAKKRFLEDAGEADSEAKRTKTDSTSEDTCITVEETTTDKLNFSVTPLWNIPYPEQIELKFKFIVETLKKLTVKLNRIMYDQDSFLLLKHTSKAKKELCCELLPCIPSPVVNGYRNKCEFTIAAGPDGEKTVGFRLGLYKDGFSGVAEPSQCIHISDTAKKVASVFQKYIRQSSMEVFDLCHHTGHWQTMTVRTTESAETMVVIQFNKQDLTELELNKELKEVKTFFSDGEGKECNVTSLFVQISSPRTTGKKVEKPMKLLSGTPHIHEVIAGVKFRISPDSFFQVNIKAAEMMFDIMKDWMGDCSKSTLLDICCGTGTIGLCLAKYVSKVIGIELVENAVEDAKMNAEMNGIKNARFVAGKAEDELNKQVANIPTWNPVIGIADPPRAGLHKTVIKGMRACKRMERLIYVSCNANSAFENFLDLCRPISKRVKTLPFRLIKSIPIDFFPHTHHCELLMLFERDKSSEETFQYYKFFY